jgi:hypothetical protein
MGKSNNSYFWKDEDVEYLKSVWEDRKVPTKEICSVLKRDRVNISAKARSIGLSRPHHSIFSKEEIETLKENYPNMSAKDLKDKFFNDKTEEQIINAGWNHKLKKTDEYLSKKQIEVGIENLKNVPDSHGENSPKWVERDFMPCDNCGTILKRTKAKTKNKNFCDRKCLSEYQILSSIGSLNPNWNGGYSTVKQYGRLCIKQWKIDSMKACDYKCVITGNKFVDIHHVYPYHEIFLETISELGFEDLGNITLYNDEQIILFRNKIIENHKKYPLGVCLSREVHEEFHNKYGRVGCTMEDWNEFVSNYK